MQASVSVGITGCHRLGSWNSRDSSSAVSNSLCYLEQVPVLYGAQVSHLENNSIELDAITAPFQIGLALGKVC